MSNTPFDIQEHFHLNLRGRYDVADLAASTTGPRPAGSVVMNNTMQMYGMRSGMHTRSPERFITRAMVIAIPLERNDIDYLSYYNMIQNDSARSNTSQLVPPCLPRIVSIALPPLSPNIQIQIHTLITYRSSTSPIYWNISFPPPTALLAITDRDTRSMSRWSHDVAVVPNVSSFTIRVRGVARPIVVFPAEVGLPIRVFDILRAVYSALRAEALENGADASDVPAHGANRRGSRGLAFNDAVAAGTIRRHLCNRVWWNGLSQSPDEVDVWVLHLRGPSRGRYRW